MFVFACYIIMSWSGGQVGRFFFFSFSLSFKASMLQTNIHTVFYFVCSLGLFGDLIEWEKMLALSCTALEKVHVHVYTDKLTQSCHNQQGLPHQFVNMLECPIRKLYTPTRALHNNIMLEFKSQQEASVYWGEARLSYIGAAMEQVQGLVEEDVPPSHEKSILLVCK